MGFVSFSSLPVFFSLTSSTGVLLMKNLRRSVRWSKTQQAFASAISAKHSDAVLERWAKMREDFNTDPKKPNLYVEPRVRKSVFVYFTCPRLTRCTEVTLTRLKQVLATEEASQLSRGQKLPRGVTPSGFFRMAIDIEERQ